MTAGEIDGRRWGEIPNTQTGYWAPQSEIPSTTSHSGQVQTFGVFAAGAFSRRVAQSVMSASQPGQTAMLLVNVNQ